MKRCANRRLLARIAIAALITIAIVYTMSAETTNPSSSPPSAPTPSPPSPAETQAGRESKHANTWAIVWILGSAVVTAWITWWAIDKSGKAQDLTLARYQFDIEQLNKANLVLRGQVVTLETNAIDSSKGLAKLQKAASDALAAQQRVELQLAAQQERTAIAERTLVALQQRVKDRRVEPEQRAKLVAALKAGHKGSIIVDSVNSLEASNFATDLLKILVEAGWQPTTAQPSLTVSVGESSRGVFVIIRDANAVPPRANSLMEALTANGIPAEAIVDDWLEVPQKTPGDVKLLVGLKP